MNAHLVPFLNALRTRACTSCGRASIDWMEVRPDFACDIAAMEDVGILPDLAAAVRKEVTFDERTAAHWARPTVPPRDLNCKSMAKHVRGYC